MPFKIAVLFEKCQAIDITCVDILGNCSTEYVTALTAVFPGFDNLLPHSVDMEWIYVSSTLDSAPMTVGMRCVPDTTYADAPRDVDLLFAGGPISHSPESVQYIREVCADPHPKVIMSVCTGGAWLADAGVLDGIPATTNRAALEIYQQQYPAVQWKDQRWVVTRQAHLEFWTSGGAGAGIDMLLDYIKRHFHESIATMSGEGLDCIDLRGMYYQGRIKEEKEEVTAVSSRL